jgi:serine/threonine protein kinase
MIDKTHLSTEMGQTLLAREIAFLKQMNHPFIAKFFFFEKRDDGVGIAQELAAHGSLLDFVNEKGPIPENRLRFYFMQLVSVVDYLHNVRKVAHRDIKLENILLDDANNLKVVDFGVSHAFCETSDLFTTPCGSPVYKSPELLGSGRHTPAVDIWSLGIVLYACACGRFPFFSESIDDLSRKITSGEIQYPVTISDSLIDLLKRMLCRDPESRVTIAQIIEHPWFPTAQYRRLSETVKTIFGLDHAVPEVDHDVISDMSMNEIASCDLIRNLKAGEENDSTILYEIYLRQKRCAKMNSVVQMTAPFTLPDSEQTSFPVMQFVLPAAEPDSPRPEVTGQMRSRNIQSWGDDVRRLGSLLLRRPCVVTRRGRFAIQPIRPFKRNLCVEIHAQ